MTSKRKAYGVKRLQVFIDGVEAGSIETTGEPVAFNSGNNSFAAKMNNGSNSGEMFLQEIRLFNEVKDAPYFSSEHSNFCHADFVEAGSTIDEAIFASQN